MKNRFFPNSIFQIFILLLFIIFYSGILIFIIEKFINDFEVKVTINFLISLILTILTVFIVNFKRKVILDFNFKINNKKILLLSIFFLFFFVVAVGTPFNRILSGYFTFSKTQVNPFSSIFYIITTVVLAPILEEIIFRGIILKGLLTRYSPIRAITISVIVFALVHFDPAQILGAMLYGLFFGISYYKTKSVGFTIILHMFTNIIVMLSTYSTINFGKMPIIQISDVYGNFSVTIILVCTIASLLLIRKLFILHKN